MPHEDKGYEHFTVDGVPFDYRDPDITPEFHHTSTHGGPIRAGLQVRITYLHAGGVIRRYDKDYHYIGTDDENKIIKLEASNC